MQFCVWKSMRTEIICTSLERKCLQLSFDAFFNKMRSELEEKLISEIYFFSDWFYVLRAYCRPQIHNFRRKTCLNTTKQRRKEISYKYVTVKIKLFFWLSVMSLVGRGTRFISRRLEISRSTAFGNAEPQVELATGPELRVKLHWPQGCPPVLHYLLFLLHVFYLNTSTKVNIICTVC